MRIYTLLVLVTTLFSADLDVVVSNLPIGKKLYIAFYSERDEFASFDRGGRLVYIEKERHKVSFNSLQSGEYAVALFCDMNGNEKLDYNFFGTPKEPYGFSIGTKPDFESAKFELKEYREIFIEVKR